MTNKYFFLFCKSLLVCFLFVSCLQNPDESGPIIQNNTVIHELVISEGSQQIRQGGSLIMVTLINQSENKALPLTLLNRTGTTITLKELPVLSGENASCFTVDTTKMGKTLKDGQKTDFTITFKALDIDTYQAALTIKTDHRDYGVFTISLLGFGKSNDSSKDIVINVGNDKTYKSLKEALNVVKNFNLKGDQKLQIKLDAGIYQNSSADVINLEQGSRVEIVGAEPSINYDITDITVEAGGNKAEITLKTPLSTGIISAGQVAYLNGVQDQFADNTDAVIRQGNDSLEGAFEVSDIIGNGNNITGFKINSPNVALLYDKKPVKDTTGKVGQVYFFNTIFKYTSCDGIIISKNHTLAKLDKIALVGNGNGYGIGLLNQSFANTTEQSYQLAIVNFFRGLYLEHASTMFASGIASCHNKECGILCSNNSTLYAPSSRVTNNKSTGARIQSSIAHLEYSNISNNRGYGLLSYYAATVYAANSRNSFNYSTQTGSSSYGFLAEQQSLLYVYGSIQQGSQVGYFATWGSQIIANNSRALNNNYESTKDQWPGKHGYLALYSGLFHANSSIATNTGYCYSSLQNSSAWAYGSVANGASIKNYENDVNSSLYH